MMGLLGSSEFFISLWSLAVASRSFANDIPHLVMRADFFNAFTFDVLLFSSSCIFRF